MLGKGLRRNVETNKLCVIIAAELLAVLALQAIFWLGILRHIELPGLYMDAVNPDYLAAQALRPEFSNPKWTLPTVWFPILGNLYHGVQNYYLDLPMFWFFGTGIVTVRISQALFGSAIILVLYLVSIQATGNRLVAFLATVCLATDISFLASFRTQFYIILGGVPWLLGALFCLFMESPEKRGNISRLIISGLFFGLAVYAYFVFIFFMPAIIFLVYRRDRTDFWKYIRYWLGGFFIGSLPYVVGYVSMGIALGGFHPAIDWLKGSVGGLAPLSSKLSFSDSWEYALNNAAHAISNAGNELMIFGQATTVSWARVKIVVLVLAILVGVVAVVRPKWIGNYENIPLGWWLFSLPLSYMIIAAIFGNRLWVHHFSALVPVVYLVSAVGVGQVLQALAWRNGGEAHIFARRIIITCACLFVFFNLYQQHMFFSRLDKTGGVGKASSALTVMAQEALASQVSTVYFFPEWGFFMSFNLLTGNRVAYELEINEDLIKKYYSRNMEIRVLLWNESDCHRYSVMLQNASRNREVTVRVFHHRDGTPSFYMLQSRPNDEVKL